jgi:hypothetical protein
MQFLHQTGVAACTFATTMLQLSGQPPFTI